MTDLKPHERVSAAGHAYKKAHETIRQHASKLQAERQAKIDAGAQSSQLVDEAVKAGTIHAGTTLDPNAAP